VLDDVIYMTSVRVRATAQPKWDAFYDDWVHTFVHDVPATRRGARWRVTAGLANGSARLPPDGWPTYLATMEYDRPDRFILSRAWRRRPEWQPRVDSFKPWFPVLEDYATLNLQCVERRQVSDAAAVPGQALLSQIWTIDSARLEEFDAFYGPEVLDGFLSALDGARSVGQYVALLAQLHRYGGPDGQLVIPQRHHIEDEGRLCYVTLCELDSLPTLTAQWETLERLAARLARWDQIIADRQEAFAERILLVEH
jgi:hypothetical protein